MSEPLETLSPPDAEALDALIEAGFDLRQVPQALQPRARILAAHLHLLDTLEVPSASEDRVQRVLHAVSAPAPAADLEPTVIGFISLREIAALAALVLLGVSLSWPLFSHLRHQSRELACQANLAAAFHAMDQYARDHQGAMPATLAHLGDPWGQTNQFNEDGSALSNSAHLFVAVRSGHASLESLSCPANEHAVTELAADMRDWPTSQAVSYSYQNQYTPRPQKLSGARSIAILADKNPFFEDGQYRLGLDRESVSGNHAAMRGQNVLLTDGHVEWMLTPRLINRDNIYHAGLNGADYYTGLEGPADEFDSFLVP